MDADFYFFEGRYLRILNKTAQNELGSSFLWTKAYVDTPRPKNGEIKEFPKGSPSQGRSGFACIFSAQTK